MHRQGLAILFCTALCWAPSPAGADDGLAAEPGRWRTTTVSRVEMAGAPAMAPQTHTQEDCVEDGAFDPEGFLDPESGCRAENVQIDGRVMTYEMVCPGPSGPMRGSARYEFGRTRGSGRVEIVVDAGGVSMRTIVEITAVRLGDC